MGDQHEATGRRNSKINFVAAYCTRMEMAIYLNSTVVVSPEKVLNALMEGMQKKTDYGRQGRGGISLG